MNIRFKRVFLLISLLAIIFFYFSCAFPNYLSSLLYQTKSDSVEI
jgi:hypothetical protein